MPATLPPAAATPWASTPMVWIPFLWNAFAMEWIGMQCIAIHSIPYQWIAIDCSARRAPGWGKRPTSPGALSLQFRQRHKSPGGENHAQLRCRRRPTGTARPCSPHRLRQESVPDAGQDYCHDHIIRAAAATGVITEVRAGAVDGLDRRGPRRQAGGQEALRSHRTGERTLGRGLEQDHPGGRGVGAQCPQDGAR